MAPLGVRQEVIEVPAPGLAVLDREGLVTEGPGRFLGDGLALGVDLDHFGMDGDGWRAKFGVLTAPTKAQIVFEIEDQGMFVYWPAKGLPVWEFAGNGITASGDWQRFYLRIADIDFDFADQPAIFGIDTKLQLLGGVPHADGADVYLLIGNKGCLR